ncbi:MAG: hypothetical protein E7396_08310 [Ruminococcaceae bacterium]|nr:hypothetical protein [Oscillospiraceae bacterium]
MKKVLAIMLSLCMMFTSFTVVNAADDIKVIVKDQPKTFDQMPVIIDGRTLVPMRGIFEALGATIAWDDATKTVTAKKSGETIILKIGDNNATVSGETKTLDVAPQIINGRTMVPVRFVSEALGEEVGWNGDTRTVTVGKGKLHLAEIINPIRRPVPTEFTKSNNPEDLIFYPATTNEEFSAAIPDKYDEVIIPEDLLNIDQLKIQDPELDIKASIEGVDGTDFGRALRVEVKETPKKETDAILRFDKLIKGMKKGDVFLITFQMRCVEPVKELGEAKVKVQVEHPETYEKALFEQFTTADSNWTTIYLVFTGIEGCEKVGIRFGYGPQIVEVGNFSIKNFGQGVTLPSTPVQGHEKNPELRPEAEWRKEALDRIEKIRKGDFNVIVKDKDGNVIKDAEVELDMFDHEFEWGSIFRNDSDFAGLFNATVPEHDMKWGPYNPKLVMSYFDKAWSWGVRYYRGHSIIFEKLKSGKGTELIPPVCGVAVENKDKAMLDKLIRDHMADIMPRFDKYVVDWDVENEMNYNSLFRDAFGEEYVKEIYDWAREYDPDGMLYYNETSVFHESFRPRIENLIKMGADIDGIGIQSHVDMADVSLKDLRELYEWLGEKGFRVKITEFSCGKFPDEILRASYMRDFMINMFSVEAIDGFYMWGYRDGDVYATYSLFYDREGNRKPCLDQWEDLVYNKWWTKDAKATTDAEGKATVRGFYGDYDVTVTHNGITKTVETAFHKGYNNTLEIVLE